MFQLFIGLLVLALTLKIIFAAVRAMSRVLGMASYWAVKFIGQAFVVLAICGLMYLLFRLITAML